MKKEIEDILAKYDITLKQFISYVVNKGKVFIFDKTLEKYNVALERNNGLYIGRMRMSNEYVENNCENLQRIARISANKISKQYEIPRDKIKDLTGDILQYMIEMYGDIVNNFSYDDDLVLGLLYGYIIKIGFSIYSKNSYYHNIISLDSKGYNRNIRQVTGRDEASEECYMGEINKSDGKNQNKEEKLINIFKNFLANGYSKEETLENVSKIFKIRKDEMIEIMKNYLLNNGKVKQDMEQRIYVTELGI